MLIHKNLKKFLELIYNEDMNFNSITPKDLYKNFKNNEYYSIKNFCLDNNLIIIEHNKINLTGFGVEFFNILKKCKKI